MTIKEERGNEWRKVNEAFDSLNLVGAETVLDSIEVMIQGEDEAETELKTFNEALAKKSKEEYEKVDANIKKWGMNAADANIYATMKDGQIKSRNVEERRKFIYRLARKHDLFVTGE